MDMGEKLTPGQCKDLLETLRNHFKKNMDRHKDLDWDKVEAILENKPDKLWILNEMERTGGEPDVVGYDNVTGEFFFCDCSAETPTGRRSLCYDREGLESRKDFRPENSALEMAHNMGIELLTEEQYLALQKLGIFDTKTSSWIKTPSEFRVRGGALFGNYHFGRVFIYYNGAQSYYAARGFRGMLKI
jgi:hypothetical protein